jgi:phosphate uptake regulator
MIISKKKQDVVVMTPKLMMEKANNMVEQSLSMFKRAVDQVDEANTLLAKSVEENDVKIQSLQEKISNVSNEKLTAEENIKANLVLREKLSQFVVR